MILAFEVQDNGELKNLRWIESLGDKDYPAANIDRSKRWRLVNDELVEIVDDNTNERSEAGREIAQGLIKAFNSLPGTQSRSDFDAMLDLINPIEAALLRGGFDSAYYKLIRVQSQLDIPDAMFDLASSAIRHALKHWDKLSDSQIDSIRDEAIADRNGVEINASLE